jgi:hypothetical protein
LFRNPEDWFRNLNIVAVGCRAVGPKTHPAFTPQSAGASCCRNADAADRGET